MDIGVLRQSLLLGSTAMEEDVEKARAKRFGLPFRTNKVER
jgi:hypothetical protein